MGSPRDTQNETKAITAPTVNEIFQLLALGSKVWAENALNISGILTSIKDVLLPMVRELDKPLPNLHIFRRDSIMAKDAKQRGMVMYDGYGEGSLSIALHRSGDWFVEVFKGKNAQEKVFRADSNELAILIVGILDEYWSPPFSEKDVLGAGRSLGNGTPNFLKEFLRYARLLSFLGKCHEAVDKAFQEREERFKVMRRRVEVMGQFVTSLDPLASGRKSLALPTHSIYRQHPRGSDLAVGSYFATEALTPFWERIKSLCVRKGESYVAIEGDPLLESVEHVASMIRDRLSEIHRFTTPDGISGLSGEWRTHKTPLTKEEIEVLSKFIEALK